MPSAPPRRGLSRLAILGLAVAAALGGKGRRLATAPGVVSAAGPAAMLARTPPPKPLSWGIVVGALLVAAIVAASVSAGYHFKHVREQRAAAIELTQGDPDAGRELTKRYGCRGCHTIPGVPGAKGNVGPDLGNVARQVYVGGVVTNTPDNLIRWIENPKAIDPKTAMPVTGISAEEARDVAAYLYSLP